MKTKQSSIALINRHVINLMYIQQSADLLWLCEQIIKRNNQAVGVLCTHTVRIPTKLIIYACKFRKYNKCFNSDHSYLLVYLRGFL